MDLRFLEEHGADFQRLWNLHPDDQKWLRPILCPRAKTVLMILDKIADRYASCDEISTELGFNFTTIVNILCALETGGFHIEWHLDKAHAPTISERLEKR